MGRRWSAESWATSRPPLAWVDSVVAAVTRSGGARSRGTRPRVVATARAGRIVITLVVARDRAVVHVLVPVIGAIVDPVVVLVVTT